ncbi:MAG: hypothetical protein AB1767_10445 [Bacillota bacterium]
MVHWKDSLAALIPYYDRDGSNATLVYRTGGQVEEDRRTVKWNLKRLARHFSIDLEAVRKNHGERLGTFQGVPLPFSAALVLVPLKTRQAIGRNDGCCGYFNPAAICKYYPDAEKSTVIVLDGGQQISCLFSMRTVHKRLKASEIVLESYRRQLLPGTAYINAPGSEFHSKPHSMEPLFLALIRELLTLADGANKR